MSEQAADVIYCYQVTDPVDGVMYYKTWSDIYPDWKRAACAVRISGGMGRSAVVQVIGDRGQRSHRESKRIEHARETARTFVRCWCGDWRPADAMHYSGGDPESGAAHPAREGEMCDYGMLHAPGEGDDCACGDDDDAGQVEIGNY